MTVQFGVYGANWMCTFSPAKVTVNKVLMETTTGYRGYWQFSTRALFSYGQMTSEPVFERTCVARVGAGYWLPARL